ncbi:unnamed protein product [Coffea canephora]|uniref:RING-type domain-containing protein n=1 Tax=Coffea canephora TaxID=49390 RepID=A0A068U2Y3_COFCA|nr:unnamed protein product [Coffea canephora]
MPIIQEISGNYHRHPREHGHNDPQSPAAPPRQLHQSPKRKIDSAPRKLLFLFLKWIIMTFILSLLLIFVGFAALVLLHILLTTAVVHRHRHRRRRQTRRSFSRSSSLYSMQEQDLYDLLPHLNYSASEQTTMDCAICLESFKEGELSRKLPDCNHLFHLNCVDNWLTKKPNCPVCRTRVQLHSGASRSRDSDDDGKFWWPVGA